MNANLKALPCPFCGESEIVDSCYRNDGLYIRRTAGPGGSPEGTWEYYNVECNNCGCRNVLTGDTPEEAVEIWNKRSYNTEEL